MNPSRVFAVGVTGSLGLMAATLVLYALDPGYRQPIMRRQFVQFTYRGQRYELCSIKERLSFDNQPQIRLEEARIKDVHRAAREKEEPLSHRYNEIGLGQFDPPSKEREEKERAVAEVGAHIHAIISAENTEIAFLNQVASAPVEHTVPWLSLTSAFALPPLVWLVGFLFRTARRCRRRATGRCVNCGYDLRASPRKCPECGRVQSEMRGNCKAGRNCNREG